MTSVVDVDADVLVSRLAEHNEILRKLPEDQRYDYLVRREKMFPDMKQVTGIRFLIMLIVIALMGLLMIGWCRSSVSKPTSNEVCGAIGTKGEWILYDTVGPCNQTILEDTYECCVAIIDKCVCVDVTDRYQSMMIGQCTWSNVPLELVMIVVVGIIVVAGLNTLTNGFMFTGR